jgi:hypothetical protein
MEVRAAGHVHPDDVAIGVGRLARGRERDGRSERKRHLGKTREDATHGIGPDDPNGELRGARTRRRDGLTGMDPERAGFTRDDVEPGVPEELRFGERSRGYDNRERLALSGSFTLRSGAHDLDP